MAASSPHRLSRARSGVFLRSALVLLAAAGCASAPEPPEATPYTPPEAEPPPPIGFFLTEFDASVRAWTNLELSGTSPRERAMIRGLEREMGQRARRRQEELLAELEGGPPTNRAVAAAALGFTGDPSVLSPLLNALSDPEADVVHNALLGLGRLGHPETPPDQIAFLLRSDPDPWIRNNAAYALQRIVAAGAKDSSIARACLAGLADEEAGVRAQCASVLAMLDVRSAIERLGDLLYDDVGLVCAAAASSLARLGQSEPKDKGRCARLLADALDRVARDHRPFVLQELERLSGVAYGDDAEPWKEWAYRLP